jgi:hypothetical protein
MKNIYKTAIVAIGSLAASFISAKAQIIITEVDPAGSSSSTGYSADWFELTNEGTSAVSIAGWKIDDNSDSFSDAVALDGISSIAAKQSVVFIENTGLSTSQTNTLLASFEKDWFGSTVPVGFTIGYYGGSGVGLSQTTDGVNIFNSSGAQVTGVNFGVDSAPSGATFDNSILQLGAAQAAGNSHEANDPTISTFSVLGKNGAFNSSTSDELGSPGAVPEPGTYVMVLGGVGLLAFVLRRRVIAGI